MEIKSEQLKELIIKLQGQVELLSSLYQSALLEEKKAEFKEEAVKEVNDKTN